MNYAERLRKIGSLRKSLDYVFTFGKYKGRELSYAIHDWPPYVEALCKHGTIMIDDEAAVYLALEQVELTDRLFRKHIHREARSLQNDINPFDW